jgi:DNA-binding CsgD family transcriptional regulator
VADTEQEGVSPATAGGAPAPIVDLSAFEAAGKALAEAYIAQSQARGAFFTGLLGGLHPTPEADSESDPRDAEIERQRAALYSLNVAHGNFVAGVAMALGGVAFVELRELTDQIRHVLAERDRLRQDLNATAWEATTAETNGHIMANAIDDVREILARVESELIKPSTSPEKPAEPRRWYSHSPEPERPPPTSSPAWASAGPRSPSSSPSPAASEVTTVVDRRPPLRPLKAREIEVTGYIADGLTYAQIGHKLHLSPHTVKDHATRAMHAVGARSKAHLVAIAIRTGLIDQGAS